MTEQREEVIKQVMQNTQWYNYIDLRGPSVLVPEILMSTSVGRATTIQSQIKLVSYRL